MNPGTRLGPYEIVAMLGAGGMGEVYRARDTRLDRFVAIKILPPEFSNPELRARFEHEARAISSISDPHICALFDVGEAEVDRGTGRQKVSYIVMEFLEGESLASRIARGPLVLEQCLRYGAEIASGLASAHRRGVIHRDLKPGNVMITAAGAKLLDFGLAKTFHSAGSEADVETPTEPLTGTGLVVGTLPYMAPEQLEGRELDSRTDIFALGLVLYEMATARRAFDGNSSASVISAILRDEPQPISAFEPAVPQRFERVVRRCLTKDPEARWQSAQDIAAELEEIREETGGGRRRNDVIAAPVSAPSAPRVRRAIIAGAIVLLAAFASGLLWLVRRTRALPATAPPRIEVAQLTTLPGVEWFPSLSPDGKWVVYGGMAGAHHHIYLQGVGGQKPVDLTEDPTADDDQPAFSPDGERIAFRSSREGGGIFVMGRTGEAVRRVTRAGFRPAWSPDGSQLVYATENVDIYPQNVAGVSELWTVPVSGGEAKRLQADAILPSWSPHNHRIAFTRRSGNPFQADICTIPVAGGTPVPVTNDVWTDWSPAWSSDGKYLYFVSDRGGSMNVWRSAIDELSGKVLGQLEPMNLPSAFLAHPSLSSDGRLIAYTSALVTANIQRLDFDPVSMKPRGDPAWVTTGSRRWSSPDPSPDGEWVAFYSLTQPEGDLYVSRADGTGLRQITGDAAIDRMPRWSPDGKWLAFYSNRGGPLELWKVRPDGSDLRQITVGKGGYMAWSPDSTRIATRQKEAVAVFDPNRAWSEQKIETLPPMDAAATPFLVNSWSADGERIAGTIETTGASAPGIATYSVRSRSYERITDFGEWPVWLPDSRRILFVAGGKGFYVVDTRTKAVQKIYSVTADVIGPPRITNSGTAYFSRRITEADIWIATLK